MKLPSPVAYLLYQGHALETPSGTSYAYVLAGNGVFKFAHSRHLTAAIPVASATIRGLPSLTPSPWIEVSYKLPAYLLQQTLADARKRAWDAPCEAMYHVRQTRGGIVSITTPEQVGSVAHLAYAGGGDEDIFMDVHSHCEAGAFFSGTDNCDEQGLRFYAVIGRIFTRPEIALRVGIYGDHWRVPATWLFADIGPFVDTYREVCRG